MQLPKTEFECQMHAYVSRAIDEMTFYIRNYIHPEFQKPVHIFSDHYGTTAVVEYASGRIDMVVSLNQLRHMKRRKSFVEYDHIKDDPDIGEIRETDNWFECANALIAHEMAHVLDMSLPNDLRVQNVEHVVFYQGVSDDEVIDHGERWQYFYRILRKKFQKAIDYP